MNRKYFSIVIALTLISIILIIITMCSGGESLAPVDTNDSNRPIAPFKTYISGVGIVEASSGNISIGTPVNRIVEQVFVNVGDEVKTGEVLFRQEDRDLQADLLVQEVAYENALAELHKLQALPRKEDIEEAAASLKISEANLELAKSQYEMVQNLQDPRAVSQEEVNRRRFQFEKAQAELQQARASFSKIKEGTWKPDLDIAFLKALQAKANVERVKIDIARTIIKSPIDGTVLQNKIHTGEFPSSDLRTPIMIVGNTNEMHLNVSVNQYDVPYLNSKASAVAFLQGDPRVKFTLEFVRIEPYLIGKENLSNEITERSDTRVLHVIYKIKKNEQPVYVGQQMDAFIEAHFDQ